MTMPRNLWEAILEIQAGRAYFNYELNRYVFAAEFDEKLAPTETTPDTMALAVEAIYGAMTRREQNYTSTDNVRAVLLALARVEEDARRRHNASMPPPGRDRID